jgi:hypothetical protein
MFLRKIISVSIVFSSIRCVAPAQENPRPLSSATPSAAPNHVPSRVVVPITDLKFIGSGLKVAFGTGFCVNAQSRFIGANYRVAETAHQRGIKGQKVVEGAGVTGPEADSTPAQLSLNRGRGAE